MNDMGSALRSRAAAWCCPALLLAACSVYEGGLLGGSEDSGTRGGSATTTEAGTGGGTGGGSDAAVAGAKASSGDTSTAGQDAGGATPAGGTGGEGSVAGSAGGGGTAVSNAGSGGSPPIELTLEPLDDMEDGNAFVLARSDRNGHWDVSNDGTPGAAQTPAPASFVMAEIADATRADSRFAAYTKGGGFKGWGAVLTVSMITWPDYAQTPPYDASSYAGISFWAKAGAGSDTTLRVRFVGAQTDDRGGQCTPGGDIGEACFDHFFADVKLSQDWQRFQLLFADFRQAGVGKKFPQIDLQSMYALEFFFPGRSTSSGNAFELWVDDLAFGLK